MCVRFVFVFASELLSAACVCVVNLQRVCDSVSVCVVQLVTCVCCAYVIVSVCGLVAVCV